MSLDKRCVRHNLPDDVCGPCNAAREERERIIALLKAELGPNFAGDSTAEPKDAFLSVKWLIALIRGEN